MTPTPRVPAGTPVGGRFTATEHAEATITLDDLEAAEATNTANPTTASAECPTCSGERIVGLEICSTCDGSGSVAG